MNDNQSNPTIPEASTLFERATESAKETRQTVITMSTGSLAVFFFALTTKVEPELTISQQLAVLFALGFMALAAFAGLWSAWSDARWSYSWAREVQDREHDPEWVKTWKKRKDYWHTRKDWGESYSLLSFLLGVGCATIYVVLRTFAV